VLDLDNVTVLDVMTPRHQVVGIDLEEPWPHIYKTLVNSRFSKLPVYEGSLDHIIGILHVRSALSLIGEPQLNSACLRNLLRPAYYIPESTSLQQQLVKFQDTGEQIGIVVDEYGDIQGIATLGDILEEIVGEITDHHQALDAPYYRLKSGAYIVDGSITIRDINRYCHFNLPADGPKTLSGLIIERLQAIPEPKTSLTIGDHTIEILSVEDNAVQKTKIKREEFPPRFN
jgi:Mg2+/Co2+ transporter CorB